MYSVRLGQLPGRLLAREHPSTTCAFSFGVYRRRAMPTSFRSARFYPEQHRARRSNVTREQDMGVTSFVFFKFLRSKKHAGVT